jgi:hypothetical protein
MSWQAGVALMGHEPALIDSAGRCLPFQRAACFG